MEANRLAIEFFTSPFLFPLTWHPNLYTVVMTTLAAMAAAAVPRAVASQPRRSARTQAEVRI